MTRVQFQFLAPLACYWNKGLDWPPTYNFIKKTKQTKLTLKIYIGSLIKLHIFEIKIFLTHDQQNRHGREHYCVNILFSEKPFLFSGQLFHTFNDLILIERENQIL